MAYSPLADVEPDDVMTLALYNQIKANFEASAPAIFTAAGQLVAGTGSGTHAVVPAPGADKKALVADSAQATGLNWAGGVVEIGMIIIWSGAVVGIPGGWQLCNGTNGTPDLRGMFIAGAGSGYAVGDNGGAATANLQHTHTPTAANTGSDGAHTHTQGSTGTENAHTHTKSGNTGGPNGTSQEQTGYSNSHQLGTSTHTHTYDHIDSTIAHSHTNPTTGSDGAHTHPMGSLSNGLSASQNMLPAYYALCFIQRVS